MSDSATESSNDALTDFPDRLSPVLVKELRQGLRTNMFVLAFILLQAFMILSLMMGQPGDSSASDLFFWIFLFVVLLIVQPLRGFSSLSSEFAFQTMDLIQLTKLNAFRITLGKWTALNAQSLLLLVSVLPYLVMRYFYGSVDVIADFQKLLGYAYSSVVLSAITVGCSAFKHIIPRLILLIASVFGFFVFFEDFNRFDSLENILVLFTGAIVGIYFIFLGSSRIAPQSENHSTRKRILGLIGSLGCLAFVPFLKDKESSLYISGIILLIACIDALTEELPIFHGVLPRFKSAGKRLFAGAFTPGWHTGFRYTILATIPLMVVTFVLDKSDLYIPILFLAVVTFPLLIIHLFFRKSTIDKLALYVAIQACVVGLAAMALAVAENSKDYDEIVFLLIPIPGALLAGIDHLAKDIILLISSGWLVLTVVIMIIVSRAPFRAMRDYFRSLDNK